MNDTFSINLTIEASVPSRDWQRVANKRARRQVEASGLDWNATEIVVALPEIGRYFYKAAGAAGFGAIG